MDPVLLQTIANQPTPAAEPAASPPEGSPRADAPGSSGPGGPTDRGESGAQTTVATTLTPASTPPPAPAPVSEAEHRAALAEAQKFRQLSTEIQQLSVDTQRRQAAFQEEQRLAQIRENVRLQASTMAPEDAIAFMDRQAGELINAQRAQRQYEQAQLQQNFHQTIAAATAPNYAHHLAQTNQLGDEYERRLASMGNPYDMDRYLPVIVREAQAAKVQEANYNRVLSELDQLRRSTQANSLAASGAHSVGGAGASASRETGNQPVAGTSDHLRQLLGDNFMNFGR